MKRPFFVLLLFVLVLIQCRRQNEFALSISGSISDGIFGGNVDGVNLTLEMQILEGGVFSSSYQTVETTSTDASGNYEFNFDRENAVDYRIISSRQGYLDQTFAVDPESLMPDEVYILDLAIIPKATFDVHFESAFSQNEDDIITFKNLAVDFDCACCNSEERIFQGTDIDTTLSCNLYGESWIKFFVEIEKDTAFHSYIDSLYCPAFEVTTLDLIY